jgi:hypothetical protein
LTYVLNARFHPYKGPLGAPQRIAARGSKEVFAALCPNVRCSIFYVAGTRFIEGKRRGSLKLLRPQFVSKARGIPVEAGPIASDRFTSRLSAAITAVP